MAGQAGGPVPGRSASVATGQVIAGRVVSAADGHPIANATVTLGQEQQQRGGRRQGQVARQEQTAQTDGEGRYRLPAQTAGRYSLRASAPGYLGTLYLEHDGYSAAIVTGAGVSTEDLRFALTPEASLHGRVLDDTGEPVRATVMLFRDASDDRATAAPAEGAAPRIRNAGATQADEDGEYDFTQLRPGRYYVAANATPWYAVHARVAENEERMPYRTSIDPALDVAYPMTFYPHATDEGGATAIALRAGQRLTANMLMQAEHAVQVTVQMPPSGGAAPNSPQPFPALFRKVFGNDEAAGTQMSGRVGDTIVLSGIAPGQYVLRSFGRGGPTTEGAPVALSAGSANLTMPAVTPAATVSVDIAVKTPDGAAPSDSVQVRLQRVGPPRGAVQVLEPGKLEQGVAHFNDVPTGDYRVRISGDGGAVWSVSRVASGGSADRSALLLHVGTNAVKATAVASPYAPEIDGAVHAANGSLFAGALVVLVPAGADSSVDLYRADESDLDGGFQFSNVLPGNYLLVAIENGWGLNWRDATALMNYLPHALPVTVAASGARVVTLQEAAVLQQK